MQLNLFALTADNKLTDIETCLQSSLGKNLDSYRSIDDSQLKQMLSRQWGLGGGSTHPQHHCYIGGQNPRFWMNIVPSSKTPDFQGKQLINAVRKILAQDKFSNQ
jgi:hypothetical protein